MKKTIGIAAVVLLLAFAGMAYSASNEKCADICGITKCTEREAFVVSIASEETRVCPKPIEETAVFCEKECLQLEELRVCVRKCVEKNTPTSDSVIGTQSKCSEFCIKTVGVIVPPGNDTNTTTPPTGPAPSYGNDDGCRLSYGDEGIRYEITNGFAYGYDKKTGNLAYDSSALFSKIAQRNAVEAVLTKISPRTPMQCR